MIEYCNGNGSGLTTSPAIAPMKLTQKSDAVWTAQQDEDLRRQLANGRSINEIALRLKRSPLAIRTRVKKLGIREGRMD